MSNDEEWKAKLTPEQYHILREKGTEAPGSGVLLQNDKTGDYMCGACGQVVFKSDTKFESDMPGLVGWPAFSAAASENAVKLQDDNGLGMHRTEIVCSNCGSHLGHLFENDPSSPNGQHFCINSAALDFQEKVQEKT
jgi:peptide-methionine (R)-S-oxide reductase